MPPLLAGLMMWQWMWGFKDDQRDLQCCFNFEIQADPRLASSNEAKSQRWRHRNEGKSGVSALWVAILNVRIELWILNCQCLEGIQYNQTCWCLNKCSTLYKYTYLHTYTPWYNFLLLYMLVLCILCMLVNVYIRILEDIVWFVWYVYKSTPSVRFVRLYV